MAHQHHQHHPQQHDKHVLVLHNNDQKFQGDWDLVIPFCQEKHHGKFINPRVHEAFRKHEGHHDESYVVLVKTGPHHASDEWTVIFEVKGHKAELQKIEPGFHPHLAGQ